ncbi:MAG: peptide chain release factor N(5)-glutamine methyltransferase [Nitrospirota bacterium]
MTIAEAIRTAVDMVARTGISNARLDAELLLSHALNKNRAWLITHSGDLLDEDQSRRFQASVSRRVKREPVQYILGTQEFRGLEFAVTPDVLIPRPETELVVESTLHAAAGNPSPLILDLCTGSGCIAVSLAKEVPAARVFAADMSARALAVARENARRHGVSDHIRFLEGDLFGPLEELDIKERVDIIAANPPYIPSSDLPVLQPEVRDYEPVMALIAGPGGTEIHRRIIETAPDFLKKGGALIMEMGLGQADRLCRLVEGAGAYTAPEILKDLAGIERVIVAHRR